jgi:hypothetical protein
MLFVSVRSSDSVQVPKVLQVVEETKRMRHKAGKCVERFCASGFLTALGIR